MGENNIITDNFHHHLLDTRDDIDQQAAEDVEEEEEEEEEKALSLCDLALDFRTSKNPETDRDDGDHLEKRLSQSRRSSSESAPEFFGFLSDFSSDMCPADEIIFCGKLVPLKQQPVSFQTVLQNEDYPFEEKRGKNNHVLRKRSESLSELRSSCITRSGSAKVDATVLRNSRSLDYQKLQHNYKTIERNPSTKSVGKSEVSPKKVIKPRWYVFMFGMVKFPPEMELKDIKNRQFRRNQSVMFPPVEEDGSKKFAGGNRSSGKGSSWSLLKALSCKDHTSVAVTTSFWVPQPQATE